MSSSYCRCDDAEGFVDEYGYMKCVECGHVIRQGVLQEPVVVLTRTFHQVRYDVNRAIEKLRQDLEYRDAVLMAAIRGEMPAGEVRRQTLDAGEVAIILGKSRDWVYRHKEELGGFPATTEGLRPRVSFPRERINAYLRGQQLPLRRAPTVRSPARRPKPSTKTKLIDYEEPR